MSEKESNILDYIFTLVKWKRLILTFTITTGVMTAGITLVVPKWYTSTATILIPQLQSGINISSLMSNIPIPFGNELFNFNEESQQYMAILNSRIAQESIAQQFGLQEQYNEDNLEDTVKELRSHFDFGFTDEGGIYITVEDTSPIRASEMANSYVYFLDSLNIHLQTKQARNNREFIQKRYNQNLVDLAEAENTLEAFQKENNIISLPVQVEAAVNAYANLLAELMAKKIELETKESMLAPGHSEILQLKSEINSMNKHVKLFEENSGIPEYQEKNSKYMVPFRDTPQLEMAFLRLTREVEIQNTLFILLTEQFEQAKLQEARDTPTLLTLDVAVPSIKRSSPKRTITVLIVTGMAFIFIVFVAFTFEYINRVQAHSPQEREKLMAIRRLMSRKANMNE